MWFLTFLFESLFSGNIFGVNSDRNFNAGTLLGSLLGSAPIATTPVGALPTTSVSALTTADIAALRTDQIQALTTADIAALRTDQVQALTTTGIAALTTNQVQAFTTAGIEALLTGQIVVLNTADIAVLSTDQIVAMETVDVAALQTTQMTAFTTDQVVALTTAQIGALSTASVVALTTNQIGVIETQDVAALTTTQVAVITSGQAMVLSTTQVEALTSSQIASFTTAAYSQLDTSGTPIILDLNGDGVRTLSVSSGVKFDLFADGQTINTGWVSGGDGLLVLDRNHDGAINDGSELFGSSTKLANGEKASDGYAALRELDSNHDGVISNADAAYADLRVWVDSNSDGVSGAGETRTLESLGITKINVNATVGTSTDNGNLLGLTSTYETADGVTHDAADVWFASDKDGVNASAGTLDEAIAALNGTTSPAVVDAGEVNALPADGSVVLPQEQIALAPVATTDDLRTRVSSLAQAIGTFDTASATTDVFAGSSLNTSGEVVPETTATTLAVVSMVDVMKQYDSSGNLLGSSVTTTASSTQSLTLPGQDTAANGVLAIGVVK